MEYKLKYNEEIKKIYSERLKMIREDNKVLQKDLADFLGISRSLYGRYENEYEIMPTKYLNILCNHFDVSFDYIFEFSNKKQYYNTNENVNLKISGQRLKKLRENNKITQEKLAQKLCIANSMFTRYEKGDFILPIHVLYTLCKKYNISADYLLGKTDEPKYLK